MTLPLFDPGDDPGPDFVALLHSTRNLPEVPDTFDPSLVAHGTTVLAIKYEAGVVMAGDRRATAGNLIAHRTIEKVFPADRYSGVAIAGAAGPALEMVRLFQLQLEHYEKVEGHVISLDGKANQLGQMLRNNLPAAMQGLAVVPLFAGYDRSSDKGRLFQFDVTGGRYEEADYATTGSGSLHAGTVIKLGFQPELDRSAAIDLALSALYEAADSDSATGGPDAIRGIYPIVATITDAGFDAVDEAELIDRFEEVLSERRSRSGGVSAAGSEAGGAR